MSYVDKCAAVAQASAMSGKDVERILDEVLSCLGATAKPFTFIAVLREAFGVPIRTLRDVENWHRLNSGGDMTTSEVVAILFPFITQFVEES
jgi:hypothetical protein